MNAIDTFPPHANFAGVCQRKRNRASFSHLPDGWCIFGSPQIFAMIKSGSVQQSLHFYAIFGADRNAKERFRCRDFFFSHRSTCYQSVSFFRFLQSIRESFVDDAVDQWIHFLDPLNESFQDLNWRYLQTGNVDYNLITSQKKLSNLFRSNFHRQSSRGLEKKQISDWRHRLTFGTVDDIFEEKPHEDVEKSLEQISDDLSKRPRFDGNFILHLEFLVFDLTFTIFHKVFDFLLNFLAADYHWAERNDKFMADSPVRNPWIIFFYGTMNNKCLRCSSVGYTKKHFCVCRKMTEELFTFFLFLRSLSRPKWFDS